jgi:hypothetical protein
MSFLGAFSHILLEIGLCIRNGFYRSRPACSRIPGDEAHVAFVAKCASTPNPPIGSAYAATLSQRNPMHRGDGGAALDRSRRRAYMLDRLLPCAFCILFFFLSTCRFWTVAPPGGALHDSLGPPPETRGRFSPLRNGRQHTSTVGARPPIPCCPSPLL